MSAQNSARSNSGPDPYTAPSEDFIPAGYFSPPSPPPSVDEPRPYRPQAQTVQPAQRDQAVHAPTQGLLTGPQFNPAPRIEPPAGLLTSTRRFFTQYATFSGRSSRSEFWWVQLFIVLVSTAAITFVSITSDVGALAILSGLVALGYFLFLAGTLLPSLALLVRRLHDANLSAGFLALALIPYVGPLVVFILLLLPGSPRGARFDRQQHFAHPVYQQGPQQRSR